MHSYCYSGCKSHFLPVARLPTVVYLWVWQDIYKMCHRVSKHWCCLLTATVRNLWYQTLPNRIFGLVLHAGRTTPPRHIFEYCRPSTSRPDYIPLPVRIVQEARERDRIAAEAKAKSAKQYRGNPGRRIRPPDLAVSRQLDVRNSRHVHFASQVETLPPPVIDTTLGASSTSSLYNSLPADTLAPLNSPASTTVAQLIVPPPPLELPRRAAYRDYGSRHHTNFWRFFRNDTRWLATDLRSDSPIITRNTADRELRLMTAT